MDAVKKVLFIAYDGLTDPLGQSQIIPYLAGLSKANYQFTILSVEKKQRLSTTQPIIEKQLSEAGINWSYFLFSKTPPILAKLYDLWRLKRYALKLFKKEKFDLIHCRSYVGSEVGLYLHKKFGVPFLFDMRGFWADEKVDSGHWDLKKGFFRLLYKRYKQKEREYITNAVGIVCLTQAGKDEILTWEVASSMTCDITVIPCCSDLEHFDYQKIDEAKKASLKKDLGIQPHQKVLTYSGSLGGWYMMDEMLQFFKCFQQKYPDAVFLCLTKEPKEVMDKYIAKNNIDSQSVITTFSQREELPLYLSLSDYSIFFIRPTFSKKASSPTKHAELMGMGIPVICNDIGDTGKIIEETQSGILVADFSESAYSKAIENIPSFSKSKEEIRESAFQYFDLKTGINEYKYLYKTIFSKQTPTNN
jgi:glycosyltransferase involved in cell wall biosynthesis